MDGSYYQIIARTLAGERPADEQTDASVAILAERMERLKSHGGLFNGIEFSEMMDVAQGMLTRLVAPVCRPVIMNRRSLECG